MSKLKLEIDEVELLSKLTKFGDDYEELEETSEKFEACRKFIRETFFAEVDGEGEGQKSIANGVSGGDAGGNGTSDGADGNTEKGDNEDG